MSGVEKENIGLVMDQIDGIQKFSLYLRFSDSDGLNLFSCDSLTIDGALN